MTLYSTARVNGTIMHEALSIEDGAFIDGKLKRTDRISLEDDQRRLSAPTLESHNDNDEPASEAERLVLENLRLIR
ncbi:MAG: polymer-forming cytoskeletal protein [Alphaproteobacteria bacterium]